MLENGPSLVLFDSLWHHVQNVVHHRSSQLQVEMTLHSLLGDRLGHAFRVSTFELSREEVSEPALKERDHAPQEEEPHPPSWGPNSDPWSLSHGTSVETIGDHMLEILAHADLPHQLVLVAVHARELAHVSKDVLQTISKLHREDKEENERK